MRVFSDESWESLWGMFNQIVDRDAEALRRTATILRQFWWLASSPGFEPHLPATLQQGVYCSRFGRAAGGGRGPEGALLLTVVNRNPVGLPANTPQLTLDCEAGDQFYDVYHGVLLPTGCANGLATLNFELEPGGFGAVLQLGPAAGGHPMLAGLHPHLATMAAMTSAPLSSYSDQWRPAPQLQISDPPTPPYPDPPMSAGSMVEIPATDAYEFVCTGNIPQGDGLPPAAGGPRMAGDRTSPAAGVDVQCELQAAAAAQMLGQDCPAR